jgi:hypothetical protein
MAAAATTSRTRISVPNQLITWKQEHVPSADSVDASAGEAEFLYALKGTKRGDRQAVWEGGKGGRGIVGVVDFDDPQLLENDRYRSWGTLSLIERPISPEALRSDPVLGWRFSRPGSYALQGLSKGLSEEEGAAMDRLAGGLPAQCLPQRLPRVGEYVGDWFEIFGEPEKTFELAVYTSEDLWRAIGFPEPPVMQQRLASAAKGDRLLIPDLLAPGVVGEVKRVLREGDGPDQIARYLQRLSQTRPTDGPWRGKLIHGSEHLSPAVQLRLEQTRAPVDVWAVLEANVFGWNAVCQYRAGE